MLNAEHQLGSPTSGSAAALLAAALNVANCTSASNSPPELLSLTTTSSSQQFCGGNGNPFSPGALAQQLVAAASPLNTAAAAQQLANAQQLAAALYSSSIPSPGGSAFARLQQQVHHQQVHQAPVTTSATFGGNGQSAFGPGSPFAQLEQLALLRNVAMGGNGGNILAELQPQHQQQHQQAQLQPGGLVGFVASQLQRQAAALEHAASALTNAIPSISLPPPTMAEQQLAAFQALQQHQQQLAISEQQHQQHQDASVSSAHQQMLQNATTVAISNSSASSSSSYPADQQHQQQHQRSCSPSQMDVDCCPQQQQSATETATGTAAGTSTQQQHQHGQPIRRIRRRRPKADEAGAMHRRNSAGTGLLAAKQQQPPESSVESPNSGGVMGPFSVQPLTPTSSAAAAGEAMAIKMEFEETLQHQQPTSVSEHQQQQQQQLMIATTFHSGGGPGNPGGGPQTPWNSQDLSPPSLMPAEKATAHQQHQQQQQRSDSAMDMGRRQSIEDPDGVRTKQCRVCGDSATGYNFNVISCESCKAFFRRNALRPKEFKCPYANDCDINAVSRRFCQKCRLRKCFEVGMKKEWILSDDQLRRRKNARIKSQMSRDGSGQPRTPSSVGSMAPGSVATVAAGSAGSSPYGANSAANGLGNAFSPPLQQQQQQQQLFHQQLQQNQQNQQLAETTAAALSPAMRSAMQMLQAGGQGGAPSPLALAAAAAITKLASANSPKQQQQLSPGNGGLGGGLDASPLAAFGIGHSPEQLGITGGMEQQQPKVSPSGAHSPPPILPSVTHAVTNGNHQEVLRLAQQQLLQQAMLAQQQQRRPSDGLLLAPPQQQQSSPNNTTSLSPLAEQYHRLMMLGQQQAQGNTNNNALLNNLVVQNGAPQANSSLLMTVQPGSLYQQPQSAVTMTNNKLSTTGLPNELSAGTAGMCSPGGAAPTTTSSVTTPTGLQMASFMDMDPQRQQMLMQMKMQRTIQDELAVAMSPPEASERQSPGFSQSASATMPSTPSGSSSSNNNGDGQQQKAHAHQHDVDMDLEMRKRSATIVCCPDLRNYQLNSLEQRDLGAVRTAFASMDEELKLELMRNAKLLGIMTKEQTQTPTDMMTLLDMMMRRFVKLAKRLPTFNELSPGGKFSLLKAAMIDLLTLRGASRLDAKNQCWKSPLLNTDIKCKIDMFDRLNDDMQKSRVMNFYKRLHDKLKSDQVANNLIVITVLFIHFSDTELSAKDRELAEAHHYMYKQLLRRYLESVYGPEEAKQIFDTVPEALAMLKDVTKKVPDLFPSDKIDKQEAKGTLFEEFFHIKRSTATTAETVGTEGEQQEKKPTITASEAAPVTEETAAAATAVEMDTTEEGNANSNGTTQ